MVSDIRAGISKGTYGLGDITIFLLVKCHLGKRVSRYSRSKSIRTNIFL